MRVHHIHPSGLSLTCDTQSEWVPLGFSLSFAPGNYSPRTSEREPVSDTDRELRLGHQTRPPIDVLTHYVRPRVAPHIGMSGREEPPAGALRNWGGRGSPAVIEAPDESAARRIMEGLGASPRLSCRFADVLSARLGTRSDTDPAVEVVVLDGGVTGEAGQLFQEVGKCFRVAATPELLRL
jgi:hypothetical protein